MQAPTIRCPHCNDFTLPTQRWSKSSKASIVIGGILSAVLGVIFLALIAPPDPSPKTGLFVLVTMVATAIGAISLAVHYQDWHCTSCESAVGLDEHALAAAGEDASAQLQARAEKILSGLCSQPSTTCILEKDERVFLNEGASLLEERVVNRRYVGGSSGVSFKVVKGVSMRVGAQRGHIESERGIVPVSQGRLVLTNKRLIFTGQPKSIEVKYPKIATLECGGPIVTFQEKGKEKLRVFNLATAVGELVETLIRRSFQNS